MTGHKVSIILFVLILIALNTGHAVASPIVDPVPPHCPTVFPEGFYYIAGNNVTSQQTNDSWPYRYPPCKIVPPGPIMWA